MEILRTEHLCKTYGTGENAVRAVDNVDLSVQKGEFVAIVGFKRASLSPLSAQAAAARARSCT